ncbi:flagellar protein [Paenibacillus filicis]|uniref:Flagellar protein n=1 Tax=Paenibacillus gyeongsangnamensis TaxID=3388067 RepID=A0ABT4Q7N2_9BACL|nr:flagellar protein [Paenibacillus filicis]MCZ8512869.1 flagellar protein [Paenibacillus filicis]
MTLLKVANCPSCGKVFQKNLRNLCQACIDSYEHDFNACYSYLRDHRKAANAELSNATGVSESRILGFIKENKLLLSQYPNLHYTCGSCRKPIRQNQLCADCRCRITRDINLLKEQEAKKLERGTGFQIRDRFQR